MNLRDVLENAAKAARTKRLMNHYDRRGSVPDTAPHRPLMGYCFENARELSRELNQCNIPHRVVYGGLVPEFLMNEPTLEARDALQDVDLTEYAHPDDGYDPSIWDVVPKPESKAEIPDTVNHYWIEVDGSETVFQDDRTWHVEVAAEARHQYGQVFVRPGHPERHYIRVPDGYVKPWNRDNGWNWNPRRDC